MRALLLLLLLMCGQCLAHPLAPALLQIEHLQDNSYEVLWRISPLQSSQTAPQPRLPAHCRQLSPAQARIESNTALSQRWQIDCGQQGLQGSQIHVQHLSGSGINVIVRLQDPHLGELQELLSADTPGWQLPANNSAGSVFIDYLVLGAEHLAFGPDHLLFLLGLLVLVRGLKRLVLTLTAFTLGHSLTLSLAALGILQFSQAWMELGIAVSLLVLARELLRKTPSLLGRYPAVMAFSFGLLHGLGFAGALAEIGLPQTEVVSALLGFNLGIELGQLFLAVSVTILTGNLYRIGYNRLIQRPFATMATAYVIGSLSILWCIDRLDALQLASQMLI